MCTFAATATSYSYKDNILTIALHRSNICNNIKVAACSKWRLCLSHLCGRQPWWQEIIKQEDGVGLQSNSLITTCHPSPCFDSEVLRSLVNTDRHTCTHVLSDLLSLWSKKGNTRWRSWLRHCATSQKVAGSIPEGVVGIFHWHNPSSRTMALGSTQPLTEMSTRNIFWGGKGGRCVGLTTLPPSCADCLEIWEPQTSATLRACPGLTGIALTLWDKKFEWN